MQQIPVYLINGFLESGKTLFLQDVLMGGDFDDGQPGLLILCEEGEEEYDEKALSDMNISMITVDEESEFSGGFLKMCEKHYRPKRIFIELNGMWNSEWLFTNELPFSMEIVQVITIVDGSTFPVYLNNMRSILSNLFLNTEMVIFNRCTPEMDLQSFRRTVRGLNPRAMVYFEDAKGDPIDPGMDVPPYDLNADVIQIEDIDYGLWYLDAFEAKDRYNGKKVRFRAKVMKSRRFPDGVFVPGRNAMTCCEDDIRFVGYLCKSEFADLLKSRQWIWLTATIKYEYSSEYGEEGPVLYAESYELTGAPQEDLVYFN
ncbi:TIGR03943 family putative permease subunit [Parablautia sp. Marseille-Q6255]|uniref:TIGR03943 family putative permease subunit n=1 Tax=Parablautia sp. Marseille-Q6255 TaxID=3039593 RepID=UPI0024BD5476|nr:GTP-binding protein [Parablautia sp. Marseille-Q6255]